MPLLCPRPPGWSQVLGWAFPVLSRRLAEALGWHRAPVLSSAGPGRGPRAMSSTRLLFVELYRWVRRVRQLRQEESMDELNRLTTKEGDSSFKCRSVLAPEPAFCPTYWAASQEGRGKILGSSKYDSGGSSLQRRNLQQLIFLASRTMENTLLGVLERAVTLFCGSQNNLIERWFRFCCRSVLLLPILMPCLIPIRWQIGGKS